MANLSGLTPITTTATGLSNLILVSPQKTVGYQPQNNFIKNPKTRNTLPTLLFNYEGEQTVSLESDITDHYIEDNTALQDQISLKPITLTTHGFIGELNDVAPLGLQTLQTVANKLTAISSYTPSLSTTALIAYNTAFQAYQVAANAINAAVSAWGSLTGTQGESVIGNSGLISQANQTKQQVAFQQFYGYWQNRTLFTVQTPWAIFQNMAIQRFRAIQDAETRMYTDFEITFKRIRLASTTVVSIDQSQILQGRLASQAASEQNNGAVPVVPDQSLNSALGGN